MKYLKMLSLAAVAAMVLVALLGAGSASATVLCTKYETPCPKGEDYEPGTKIDATLEPETSLIFKTTTGTLLNTCTSSTIEGKTSTTGSATETVSAVLTTLTFGGCTGKTVEHWLGELEIHYIDDPKNATKGTLTMKATTVTMELFGVNCVYGTGAAAHIGTFTSDDSMTYATIDFKTNLAKQQGGFFCPTTIVWEAAYNVTSPKPLYVKKEMEA